MVRKRLFYENIFIITLMLVTAACMPTESSTPTVDVVGSTAAQLAFTMLTQTASAYTPTLSATSTPVPTDTTTPEPTASSPGNTITVINRPACYFGPGPNYKLESYINTPKKVELLGVGSVSGWYIIRNPYFHAPCWVAASNVQIEPGMDISIFPVMTPGH